MLRLRPSRRLHSSAARATPSATRRPASWPSPATSASSTSRSATVWAKRSARARSRASRRRRARSPTPKRSLRLSSFRMGIIPARRHATPKSRDASRSSPSSSGCRTRSRSWRSTTWLPPRSRGARATGSSSAPSTTRKRRRPGHCKTPTADRPNAMGPVIPTRARPVVTLAGALIVGLGAGSCAALGGDVASRVAEPGSEETTSEGTGREVFAAGVDVGDCRRDPTTSLADGENEIERVRTVSCLEQHAEEVYASVTLIGIEFQGIEVNSVRAYIGCIGRFEDFVGVPYAESILEVGSLTPTEESRAIGDRVVLCTVYHSEGDRLTGSLRNAHDASYELRDAATGQVTRETAVDWLKIVPGDCVQEVSDDYHETLVP